MMRTLPWVLLAISIIFNFTFAGGFLLARSDEQVAGAPEAGTNLVADEFDLTEDQKKVFARLRGEAQTRAKEMRQSLLLARQDLRSEISSDSPDPQRVSETQDRLAELYRDYRRESSEHLRQFLEVLGPEQRKAVMERIRRREHSYRGGRGLLERFDTNRDGKLDEAERSRARKYFSGRHSRSRRHYPHYRPPWPRSPGSGPRRPQGGRGPRERGGPATRPAPTGHRYGSPQEWLRRWYDTDRDGNLSDEERARARKAFDGFWSPRRPPQWMLDDFDADGDGKLSPSERAAAMKAARDKRSRKAPRKEP